MSTALKNSQNGAVTLKFTQNQRRISQHLFTNNGSLTQRGDYQKSSNSRTRQVGPLSPAQKLNFLSPRGSVQRQRAGRTSQT